MPVSVVPTSFQSQPEPTLSPLAQISLPCIQRHGLQKVGNEVAVVLIDLTFSASKTLSVVDGNFFRELTPAERRELLVIRNAAWSSGSEIYICKRKRTNDVYSVLVGVDGVKNITNNLLLAALFGRDKRFPKLSELKPSAETQFKIVNPSRDSGVFDVIFKPVKGTLRKVHLRSSLIQSSPATTKKIPAKPEVISRPASEAVNPKLRWDGENHQAITQKIDRNKPTIEIILDPADSNDVAIAQHLGSLYDATYGDDLTDGFFQVENTNCLAFKLPEETGAARVAEKLRKRGLFRKEQIGKHGFTYYTFPIDQEGPAFKLVMENEISFPSIYDLPLLRSAAYDPAPLPKVSTEKKPEDSKQSSDEEEADATEDE